MTPRVIIIYFRGNTILVEYQREIIKYKHTIIFIIKEPTDQITD